MSEAGLIQKERVRRRLNKKMRIREYLVRSATLAPGGVAVETFRIPPPKYRLPTRLL
jgi:hypothetical protein